MQTGFLILFNFKISNRGYVQGY